MKQISCYKVIRLLTNLVNDLVNLVYLLHYTTISIYSYWIFVD